jgi:hypothetical protein
VTNWRSAAATPDPAGHRPTAKPKHP